jgi:carbonic anhydrase/acetyltransferase-like protein (isoleucine patch superfamily)
MLIEHEGSRPSIAESAYVAPNAVACGDVTVGEGARVLFGAVLVADGGPVEVGSHSIVMEHALVRGRDGHAARIGAHVIVGPHAHVNGAVVERSSQPASPSSRARRSERGPRSASTASST